MCLTIAKAIDPILVKAKMKRIRDGKQLAQCNTYYCLAQAI
jgi:hypothetical protein